MLYYYGTTSKKAETIKKSGFKPNSYFTTSFEDAFYYALTGGEWELQEREEAWEKQYGLPPREHFDGDLDEMFKELYPDGEIPAVLKISIDENVKIKDDSGAENAIVTLEEIPSFHIFEENFGWNMSEDSFSIIEKYYYTIYQTNNLDNGKIYVGAHKTLNPFDDYLGSGEGLREAIVKYGKQNFEKEILFIFDNEKEMYAKEAEIVNENFIKKGSTYNRKVGGFGGFTDEARKKGGNIHKERLENDEEYRANFSALISQYHREGKIKYNNFEGKKHTQESKDKIGAKAKINQMGEKNSQAGTAFVVNKNLKLTSKVKKDSKTDKLYERLPEGWERGRGYKRDGYKTIKWEDYNKKEKISLKEKTI